jgi:hypothetical protein
MLKLVWFIPRPEDIEEFEDWYQTEHIPAGMLQERLQKFRVSRSFYPQPAFVARANGTVEPRSYRFSEGYWQTLEDIRNCYVSVHGRAALGDGTVNRPPMKTPPPPQPVLVVEEQILPVSKRLAFSILDGRYDATQACKLFCFVRLGEGRADAFDQRYLTLATEVAEAAELRGHVLGRSLKEVIRLGRVMRWPPVGAEFFDRTLEFYFESPASLEAFCASPRMSNVQSLVAELGEAHVWDAAQIQEVFYTSAGDQPLEESWKALYRTAG